MSFMDNYREFAFWAFNVQMAFLLLVVVAAAFGFFSGPQPEEPEKDEFDEYVDSTPEARFRKIGDQ